MTTNAGRFQPAGHVAKWRPLADVLAKVTEGDVLTYQEIQARTGMSLTQVHAHILRATRELEITAQRTVVNIPGVGYRIAAAGEHERLAKRQLRLGKRRVRRAVELIDAANLEDLDVTERRRLEGLAEHAANIAHAQNRRPRITT